MNNIYHLIKDNIRSINVSGLVHKRMSILTFKASNECLYKFTYFGHKYLHVSDDTPKFNLHTN